MKIIYRSLALLLGAILIASCVDEYKFGSSFLEKAPGGSVTKDTVFNNAEYTRQFLTSIYGLQYYGLPYANTNAYPYPNDPYVGKFEALSDCWQQNWASCTIFSRYYSGSHNAGYGRRGDKFEYLYSNVWEAVRAAWLLIENIAGVPDLTDSEKLQMEAEAKCLIAARYFDLFCHHGGLPVIESSFSGTDTSYDLPRGTVEENVKFMVRLLDEAAPNLPWVVAVPSNENGRWTKAGAMGLKCRILLFTASPLFNDTAPYHAAGTDNLSVWYGGYKDELWNDCLEACEKFFAALSQYGTYELVEATGSRASDYRAAFRKAYFNLDSSEVLHSVRVTTYDAFNSAYYAWHSWCDNGRNAYCPTQEYVEMFPWSDGTAFDWDQTESDGRLNEMFTTGTVAGNDIVLTRDPRLYESVIVNGLQKQLDMSTGNMSGTSYELWVGGTDGLQSTANESGYYGTGYGLHKYYLGTDALRLYAHWSYLRLPEIYLIYAEALCQTGDLPNAIKQVDVVRARVGLDGLAESNPSLSLASNKDALLQEILRERVCELGFEDVRFFDMIRYKMKDRFENRLHGLKIRRLLNGAISDTPWYDGDRSTGVLQPTEFVYEKFELANPVRYWWTSGFDPKWYLSPFPLTEVNKGYGLVQNPGW